MAPRPQWEIVQPHPDVRDALAGALGVDPILAQVLINRGHPTPDRARRFLDAPLADLSDPEQLVDVPAAADRVAAAVRRGEAITIYGDYDADGVTATSILLRGLSPLGAQAGFFIPSRFREGYGLHDGALERLAAAGARLIVAVDCGVTAVEEIARARARGQEVIVLDHHEPGPTLPPAIAVIDPKRADAGAPFREYAAAGLALQLLRAVRRRLGDEAIPETVLDLAALGTIADVVPLVADNRIIARWGLERMRTTPCTGLAALIKTAGISGEVNARHVAFALAPRINAAGRLGDAAIGVRLLTTDDAGAAEAIAAQLDAENQQRRALCDQVLAQAVEQVEARGLDRAPAIVLAQEGWHSGVIGIVASQLVDRYYRPTVLMAVDGGVAKGSARSIERFHLVDALAACADLLDRFGGHAMAAGLTTGIERVEAFARRFADVAAARLSAQDLVPTLRVDAAVSLGAVTETLARQLETLAPFGAGNPEPVLASRGLVAVTTRVMGDGQHLRLGITDGHAFAEAVGFRLGDASELLAFTRARIDLAFTAGIDRWDERERVRLVVQDLVTPGVDLAAVLTDAGLLVERLFARGEDYLEETPLGLEEAGAFYTKVAGVTFEGRQEVVRTLAPGDPLVLRREPHNPHDPHAVAVLTAAGTQIGYLSAHVASRLAPTMDSGVGYTVNVTQITGGGDRSSGVNLFVRRLDAPWNDQGGERQLRLAWQHLPAGDLVDRLQIHLNRGRPLREAHRQVLEAVLRGRSVCGVFGPGRGRRTVAEMAAAATAIAGRGQVVVGAPLEAQVDRWFARLEPRLAALGLRCVRAHGGLRFRQRQHLADALRAGAADVVLASVEYLSQRGWPAGGAAGAGLRPALLLLEGEPTIGGNTFETILTALDAPQRVVLCGSVDAAGAYRAGLGPAEVVVDTFVRTNLRLVDRRGHRDRYSVLRAVLERNEKTLAFVSTRRAAVDLAAALRQSFDGAQGRQGGGVAYYHGGLPLRVRDVLEQMLADGKLRALVCADGIEPDSLPGDIRQVVVAGLPAHRAELTDLIAAAGLDGRQATVTLLYRQEDTGAVEAVLAERHPPRAALAEVYRMIRADTERAGSMVWPDATATTPAPLSPRMVGIGLDILAEAGVIQREYDGDRWRITLGSGERKDLTTSLRYAEGMAEAQALDDLKRWAFGPLHEILKAVAGPTA